ncbi:MAG: bacterial Ig-like domain-containing protein, partial [Clostridia bacterium]|nr:bacterial Ig-like domain-containing protein [Clostridia bacterium]
MKALSKIAVIAVAAALLTAMLTVFPAAAKTPVISLNPQSVRWPATAKAAVYSCRCSNENTEYGPEFEREWYFFYNGMDFAAKDVFAKPIDYPFGDFDKDGSGFVGTTIMIANPGKGLEGTEIYCVVKSDDSHFAESTHATILFDSAAISSEAPEFTSVPAEITATAGKSFTITCDYTYQGQCSTTPMWYETPNGKLENIQLIMDAGEKKSFTDKRNSPGDYYYVFAVELESLNGKDTSISYSSPIHVRVKAGGGEQSEQSVGLEITSLPKKTSYFLGDTLSLKGLVVRYYTDLGFQDIKDGKGMGVSPTTLTKFGTNRITLIYEGLTTYFDVEVEGAPAIPLIDSLSPGVTEKLGTPVTLSVGAHSTDGGTLTYQWYSSNVDD